MQVRGEDRAAVLMATVIGPKPQARTGGLSGWSSKPTNHKLYHCALVLGPRSPAVVVEGVTSSEE